MFALPMIFLAAFAAAQDSPPPARAVTCTLSNPSYSGYCRVTEQAPASQSADDACQAVLDCLNNVQCLKTYCDATQIRGGWQLVSAAEGTDN